MMIRYMIFFALLACVPAYAVSEWSYSKASSALDNGDYAHAQELMRTMLVNDPHRADLLYDLGVASYKNKEFAQAHAYFKSASEVENGAPGLIEQALYNLGNASVQLNQLSDAIVHYERALELNEQNEFAQHNLEVVKKMLDEQQKQQHPFDPSSQLGTGDQQKQDQENDQAGDQQNKGDQQQNKQEQNQGGDQQKDQKDSSKGDDGQQNESNSGGSDNQDPSSGLGAGAKDGKDQNNQQKKEKNDQGNNKDQSKQDKQQNPDKESGKGQSKKDHQKNEPQKKDQNKNIDAASSGEKQAKKDMQQQASGAQRADQNLAPEDKWILQVLDRREDAEKKTNKELIRATVDKKLAGQDGKNCW